jgi:hypothetical protein
MLFVESYLTRVQFEWASDHQHFENRANLYLIRPVAPGRRQISDECFEGIPGSLAPLNGSQLSCGCPGLAQVSANTFLVRRMYRYSGRRSPKRQGLKGFVVVAVERQLILAILAMLAQ